MTKLALSLILLFITPALPGATLYRWTDAYGVTHFTEDPPPDGAQSKRLSVKSGAPDSSRLSARTRIIRCRDFRTALDQLNAVGDLPDDRSGWSAARDRARTGIGRWCD